MGTPASSTMKTGRHDIAENGIKHNISINQSLIQLFNCTEPCRRSNILFFKDSSTWIFVDRSKLTYHFVCCDVIGYHGMKNKGEDHILEDTMNQVRKEIER